MRKVVLFLILGFIFSLAHAPVVVGHTNSSAQDVKIEARGMLTFDPKLVGDEERVPAIITRDGVWSLEFTDKQLEITARALDQRRVIITGIPKISYHDVRGVVKFIIVTKVKLDPHRLP